MGEHLAPVTYATVRARHGVKWTREAPDVIAAWVADMDFAPPAAVTDALQGMIDRTDFGYNNGLTQDVLDAYANWQARHHNWRPAHEGLRAFTSALHALETALWHCTRPGDGVVVFSPIYHPFLSAIADSGRRLVDVPLDPDGWRLDPQRLADAIDDSTTLMLICQPHNPTGRIFDAQDMDAVATVAQEHDLLVISDEIWGDLTHTGTHMPLALDPRFAGRLVTLGSASKSFNLAALRCCVAHIDHEPLSRALAAAPGHLLGAPSVMGTTGTLAAWTHGEPWLVELKAALTNRRDQWADRMRNELPEVRFSLPEATYLGWMDFSATSIADDPAQHLLETGRLALEPGIKYSSRAQSFARINFATSEQILDDAIDRMVATVHGT